MSSALPERIGDHLVRSDVGRVRIVMLDRPAKRNALTLEMLEGLRAALRDAESDETSALLVAGGPDSFCAGGDLSWISHASRIEAHRYFAEMAELFQAIRKTSLWTVSFVRGAAIGGGVSLTLACDYRMAAEDAFFQFPELNFGSVPSMASVEIARRLPRAAALRLVLARERTTAHEARELGVVHEVTTSDSAPEDVAARLDQALGDAPAHLLRDAKQFLVSMERQENDATAYEIAVEAATTGSVVADFGDRVNEHLR
jgi:enoyl-CoA hydratase